MTLYGPNSDNTAFYENIFTHIDEIGNSDFTICGDYNLVLDPNMDSYKATSIASRLSIAF